MAVTRNHAKSKFALGYTFIPMSDRWFVVVVMGLGSASIALLMVALFWF
jgi:hypothetical protein